MLKKNLKEGVKCVVVCNNSGHHREIGTVVTISSEYNNQGYLTKEFGHQWFAYNDLEIYEMNKEDLEEKYNELKSNMRTISKKLRYLNYSGSEKLKIKEFKEYLIGEVISNVDAKKLDKTKAVMDILESNDDKIFYEGSSVSKVIKLPEIEDVAEENEKEEMEVETEMEPQQAPRL